MPRRADTIESFLAVLRSELWGLPPGEVEDVLAEARSHLSEEAAAIGGPDAEARAVERFGDPSALGAQLLEERGARPVEPGPVVSPIEAAAWRRAVAALGDGAIALLPLFAVLDLWSHVAADQAAAIAATGDAASFAATAAVIAPAFAGSLAWAALWWWVVHAARVRGPSPGRLAAGVEARRLTSGLRTAPAGTAGARPSSVSRSVAILVVAFTLAGCAWFVADAMVTNASATWAALEEWQSGPTDGQTMSATFVRYVPGAGARSWAIVRLEDGSEARAESTIGGLSAGDRVTVARVVPTNGVSANRRVLRVVGSSK